MTGIKKKGHWADDDQDTSDLAYEASVKTIADWYSARRYRYDNCCHSTGDMPFPTVANMLQERLGMGKVASYGSTCSMFWIYVFNDYS